MSTSEVLKIQAVTQANQTGPPTDPTIEAVTNSLLIDDSNLKMILKGEIQEPLNKLRATLERLNQIVVECYQHQTIDSVHSNEILACVQTLKPIMERIEQRLTRYYRMIPYLLILSPLTRLTYLTTKMVDSLKRKVSIMIGRDKLMASGGDESYDDANFWDGLEVACWICFHDSELGWKAKVVTEERKTVQNIFQDNTSGGRKKKWGIF